MNTTELTEAQHHAVLDYMVRVVVPAWMDLAPELHRHAQEIRNLPEIVDGPTATTALNKLRVAARDAETARFDAYRNRPTEAFSTSARDAALGGTEKALNHGMNQIKAHHMWTLARFPYSNGRDTLRSNAEALMDCAADLAAVPAAYAAAKNAADAAPRQLYSKHLVPYAYDAAVALFAATVDELRQSSRACIAQMGTH